MGPSELLRWQWQAYPGTHAARTNLLLHIFTVPFFWVGSVLLILGLMHLDWRSLVLGPACILVPLIAQGRGHKLEANPPAKFTGPWNFIARLFLEQWITFPRFVLSGGWWRNYKSG